MKAYLRLIAPGSGRCDVTPIFADHAAFGVLLDDLAGAVEGPVALVAGIDALGFVLGSALALRLDAGFLAVRKQGKLPVPADRVSFVDYTGRRKGLELAKGAVAPGARVLVADEWIETGAQVAAAVELVERQGGVVVGVATIHADANPGVLALRARFPFYLASGGEDPTG